MKKFLKIFEMNLHSKSYKVGAIKITASALVFVIVCLFRFSITITDVLTNLILSLISLAAIILSVIVLFIGAAECLQVSQNIKEDRKTK